MNSLFEELDSSEHGIEFINEVEFTPELNIIEYLYFNNGGGVAIGDIDNDNLEDVYFTGNQKQDRLYKNLGNLKFEDITESSGLLKNNNWSSGTVIDDINGDGHNDIYVCQVAPVSNSGTHNLLYINQGDGTFKEMSAAMGLDFSGYSTQASFFDYDKDGDLDMYLLNHSVHSANSYGSIKNRVKKDSLSGDLLFENRLNETEGKFVDVTDGSGIYSSALGYGLGLVTADINHDGWTDIYVGNDFHDNDFLYINNKDGSFTESIETYMAHCSQFSMGVDVADISGDGLNDVFTTDMMPDKADILLKSGGNDSEQLVQIKEELGYLPQYSRNMMQINNGQGRFVEQGLLTGTFASDWSWSVLLQDFDKSGSTDVFISNGIINRPNDLDYIDYINVPENRQQENESSASFYRRLIDQMPKLKIHNKLFTQDEDNKFSHVNDSDIGRPNYSNGAAYADLDRDGDLDIITNNLNGPISLLRNNATSGHFVSFDLGAAKNASVEVWAAGNVMSKEYTTTRGYQSSSTHSVYFGLGDVQQIDSVRIFWSDGDVQIEKSLSVDEHTKIEKDSKKIRKLTPSNMERSVDIAVLPITHAENQFNDFDNEPMMPYKISQEGPCALYEDFDNDGIKDLLIGGSKSGAIQYFKGGTQVPFQKIEVTAFKADGKYEDVDAASIDFNNDGFRDIYVVSGGNENNELDKALEDRIYINDQKGSFYRLEISLPHTNGSCVRVSDYDEDGFEDLFIGSRNVPGAFGVSPVSFIIKNVSGQRLEIAARMRHGMVTDALWADISEDETPELIVVSEWGPIKVFFYSKEKSFEEISDRIQIPDVQGVFRSVEVADINKDGTADIFLGNIGQNTSWQIKGGGKMFMYTDDFDKNTFPEPILFTDYFGTPIPFANKALLKSQMPSIAKIFSTYNDYSSFSSIEQLKKNKGDTIASIKYINTLSSVILLSGENGYEVVSLPSEVQMSNVEDMLWIEDDEKKGSLIYVGNSKSNSHVLGKTTSSFGGVLSDFDSELNQFTSHTTLPLPHNTISKHIITKGDNQIMIINNNDVQYQLRLN